MFQSGTQWTSIAFRGTHSLCPIYIFIYTHVCVLCIYISTIYIYICTMCIYICTMYFVYKYIYMYYVYIYISIYHHVRFTLRFTRVPGVWPLFCFHAIYLEVWSFDLKGIRHPSEKLEFLQDVTGGLKVTYYLRCTMNSCYSVSCVNGSSQFYKMYTYVTEGYSPMVWKLHKLFDTCTRHACHSLSIVWDLPTWPTGQCATTPFGWWSVPEL